jgi:hypothetical protein
MKINRRNIVKITPVAIVGLAGCMGSDEPGSDFEDSDTQQDTETDSDGDRVPDSEDDYPNDSSRSRELRNVSTTRNIQEDQWFYYTLNFTDSGYVEYEFIVRDGPAIDVILIDESEYESYNSGDRYLAYNELSSYDSAGDTVEGGPLSAGNYRLIFDNSSRGQASPPTDFENNVAEVELDITTSQ